MVYDRGVWRTQVDADGTIGLFSKYQLDLPRGRDMEESWFECGLEKEECPVLRYIDSPTLALVLGGVL
jgi:hypothetical protein